MKNKKFMLDLLEEVNLNGMSKILGGNAEPQDTINGGEDCQSINGGTGACLLINQKGNCKVINTTIGCTN